MLRNEPTLAEVLHDLWRARYYLLAGIALGVLSAVMFFSQTVPQYRASMMVSPAMRSGAPDITSMLPNNDSFAVEYVRQNLGSGDSPDFMRFESILREPSVAKKLLEDEGVRQGLAGARRFRFSSDKAPDTPEKMAVWLQENVAVEPVGATRLKRIIILHPDPAFAVAFLGRLYKAADELIRAELLDKTDKRIAYLEQELGKVENPEHRHALTKLLMDQEQIAMIMAAGEPFSAQVAEPAYAGPRPDWPRRTVVYPVAMLTGMFLAYILYGMRRRHA